MSQAGRFGAGGGGGSGTVSSLTGNSGGAVGPSVGGNINVVGSGSIVVAGNPGTNTLTISDAGATSTTYTEDTGSATPAMGNLNIFGGNNIATTGATDTVTVDLVGTTNHAVQIGNAGGSLTSVSVGTDGQVLLGATGADPAFATLTSTGGTITFTPGAHSLNLEAASGTGTLNRINGDTSFAVGPTVGLKVNSFVGNYGTSQFIGDGVNDIQLAFSTASNNTGIGLNSLINISTGDSNVALGDSAGNLMQDGSNNVLIGQGSGQVLTSGSQNAMLGALSGNALATGSNNVLLGFFAGQQLSGTESSNVLINHAGVVADANTLRIGAATGGGAQQLAKAFICGIDSVNVGSVAKVLTMASDQLGTATITAGTGVSVTPGANTITLAASAATPLVFHTGSGDATPAANALTIAGGNNISTTGAGSTVTVAVTGTTNHTIQVGNASGSLTSLAAATNGQIPIGSTGADPSIATITAGAGISVTNGAGSITIASTGATAWIEVTGASSSMAVDTGYIANNAGLVTLTLPASAALGSVFRVVGKGAGGWRIAQNSGQTIFFGSSTSTPGATGHIDSTLARDCVSIVCVTANNDFEVMSSVGNITIV